MSHVKLVIFDLDGVLVETKELHYIALNKALGPEFAISLDDHLTKFDGMSTKRKLEILMQTRGLPPEKAEDIWENKQKYTFDALNEVNFNNTAEIIQLFEQLKKMGCLIGVCSNAIRKFVIKCLAKHQILEHVDFIYSNEDVRKTKPSPEIYMSCMLRAGVSPRETLIVEDSYVGRTAALESGAHVYAVKNSSEVSFERLHEVIKNIGELPKYKSHRWNGGKMNVLIPMAGAGSRFAAAGYTFPKPLIMVKNKPMIQVVVDNIAIEAQYIFIVQKEHNEKYNLEQMLHLISPGCKVVITDGMTEGAACTTLLAKEFIDNDESLLIANSDQFVDWDSGQFMYSVTADKVDGGILTFKTMHPKWSFAKADENGFVTEVAEKKPISDDATVGIYYWKHGKDYVKYAEQMIAKNIRTNNEFYVCPVFNEAIQDGKKIKIYPVPRMWGIGTPEDLESFLTSNIPV